MNMTSKKRIENNLLLIQDLNYDSELTINKDFDDDKIVDYFRVLSNMLQSHLNETTNWLNTEEAIDFFFAEAEYQKEIFDSLETHWDEILEGNYYSVEALLDEVYRVAKGKGYVNMRETMRFTDADKQAFQFALDYNFELIRNLSDDFRTQIKNKLTEAAIRGTNPYGLASELVQLGVTPLPGSTLTAMQRATMIAKTEVSRMQNTGMLQSYVNEGYTEVKILTAEDNDVCVYCLKNAYEFNKDDEIIFDNRKEDRIRNIKSLIRKGETVPLHPNCRCTYLTVWETKTDPPVNPDVVDLTPK